MSGINDAGKRPPSGRRQSPEKKNLDSFTPSPLEIPAARQEPLVVSAALLRTLGRKPSH